MLKNRILYFSALLTVLLCAVSARGQRVSGTLPVIYINTEGGAPIVSKEEYLTADCWLDPLDTGYEAVGSQQEPVLLNIKGRGNWTWEGFDKKPYRLKFDKKQKMPGMKKSKHFALLAHADDELGFMRNTAGLELSRRIGMPWTPAQQPVELVLNGKYHGLYFLTENIRVDEDRVNIVEQPDNATDPEDITGGWLVEIDNYDRDPHVTVADTYGLWGNDLWFTYKTPEVLSPQQERYLQSQMQMLNDFFLAADKRNATWTQYVDLDQLVRYYIVQEMLDDAESFHGSCYLYKDKGEGELWKFGPVWDFGNSFRRNCDSWFIYERPPYGQAWISEIAKFDVFKSKVREVWSDFMANDYEGFTGFLRDFAAGIRSAAMQDAARWPAYGNSDIQDDYDTFTDNLNRRIAWLAEQWNVTLPDPEPDPEPDPIPDPVPNPEGKTIYLRGYFNNWGLDTPFTYSRGDGRYYVTNVSLEDAFKIADSDWGSINLGSNGTKIKQGRKYWLVSGTNDNIQLETPFRNVDMIVDLNDPSVIVAPTGTLNVSHPVVDDEETVISGNTVVSPGIIKVYDLTGTLLQQGSGRLTVTGSGMKIVVTERVAKKIKF